MQVYVRHLRIDSLESKSGNLTLEATESLVVISSSTVCRVFGARRFVLVLPGQGTPVRPSIRPAPQNLGVSTHLALNDLWFQAGSGDQVKGARRDGGRAGRGST